jgi:DNA-binding NarL/FixJ family response regulator
VLKGEPRLIRVLVADDFPLVREGLTAALRKDRDIEIVGIASDGVEALEQARAVAPDVLLLDLRMPRMSGLVALAHLATDMPAVRVLAISASIDARSVLDALAAGADGYLTKHVEATELCAAVHAVHRGEPVIAPGLARHLIEDLRERTGGPAPASVTGLTRAELSVLRLVAEGQTDRQISSALYMSPRTVQSNLGRIRAKVGVRRRTELARWATEHLVV